MQVKADFLLREKLTITRKTSGWVFVFSSFSEKLWPRCNLTGAEHRLSANGRNHPHQSPPPPPPPGYPQTPAVGTVWIILCEERMKLQQFSVISFYSDDTASSLHCIQQTLTHSLTHSPTHSLIPFNLKAVQSCQHARKMHFEASMKFWCRATERKGEKENCKQRIKFLIWLSII